MTPFTPDTASAAGSRGGARRTKAQRAATALANAARRGSGYVPRDPESVRAVLDAVRERTSQARRGGSPPDPLSLRSCAAAAGVSPRALARWIHDGQGWPLPPVVAALRRWLAGQSGAPISRS
jgi:hypothetical protein